MNKLHWSTEDGATWKARLSEDMYFIIDQSGGNYKLYLKAPIIDQSNDFHQVFPSLELAKDRAEEMFDGLEKIFS